MSEDLLAPNQPFYSPDRVEQRLRDEIERLRAEVVELRGDRDSWREQAEDRMDDWTDMRDRANTAESALAALRKRVEEAPVAEWKALPWTNRYNEVPEHLIGMRVALVLLEE